MAVGVKEALYVRGILVLMMPGLGLPGIEVFEDKSGDRLGQQPFEIVEQQTHRRKVSLSARIDGDVDLSVKYLLADDPSYTDNLTKAMGRALRNTAILC